MKTQLPEQITTQEEAETFLTQLWENKEVFHPEDSAHDVIWSTIPKEQQPTPKECERLNDLMADIYNNVPELDPCGFLLDLDEEEERRMKLARPTEF